jgi:hypothetical protein
VVRTNRIKKDMLGVASCAAAEQFQEVGLISSISLPKRTKSILASSQILTADM